MRKFLVLFFLITMGACRGAEDHPHDHEQEPGAEAVLESAPGKGFRLAPAAIATLQIRTIPLPDGKPANFPPAAFVYFQDEIGVYRLREGWFRLIHLDDPQEWRSGDEVVIGGAAYLRVTDLSLFGDPIAGHHH